MSLVIFRLTDRKVDEGSFFLNQDGTEDHTNKLDYTNTYGILNPFFINVNGAKVYQQYIQGCPFFDIARQQKEKYVANLRNTDVHFEKGSDIILDDDKMKPLVEWLRMHPKNASSKNHNPEIHEASFFEFDPKKVVKADNDLADEEDKALEVLRILRADNDKLSAVAVLFEETQHITDHEEMYRALRIIAKNKPDVFNKAIGDKESQVRADIGIAEKLGVIMLDAKEYQYAETKGTILDVTGQAKKTALKSLVDFYMSKEGAEQYRNLLIKIQQKQIELQAPKE